MTMRICHTIGSIDPASGGPATVVVRLAAAQARAGMDVTIIAHIDESRREAIDQAIESVPGLRDVRFKPIPIGGKWNRLTGLGDGRLLPDALKDADVVHMHGVWEPLLLRAAQTACKLGVPYVVRPAGMLDPWSMAQKRLKKRIAMKLGYARMLVRAAAIHTLNRDEYELIDCLKLPGLKKVIIPNGVWLEEYENMPPAGQFRSRHNLPSDAPLFLFLSRLHYKKGLDILAEAFVAFCGKNATAHLAVAGPDDGALSAFNQQIAAAGIGDRVHVVGPLYGRDKLAAFADSYAFVLPSRREGFSLAITESLICGVPAIISEGCHFPEVREFDCGRVLPLSAESFTQAMLELIEQPELVGQMAERGKELVRSHYTWPRIAQQTIELYGSFRHGTTSRSSDAGGSGSHAGIASKNS